MKIKILKLQRPTPQTLYRMGRMGIETHLGYIFFHLSDSSDTKWPTNDPTSASQLQATKPVVFEAGKTPWIFDGRKSYATGDTWNLHKIWQKNLNW